MGDRCSICGEEISSSLNSDICGLCKFDLHKRDGKAVPLQIKDHPLRQEHSPLFLTKTTLSNVFTSTDRDCSYKCDVCQKGNKFLYRCRESGCTFTLDINCALVLLNINDEKIQLNYHRQHSLHVIANHKDELKRLKCHACQEALSDSICVCFDCRFYLHKKCADDQFPLEINHPCHRRHSLSLKLYTNNTGRFCPRKKENNNSGRFCQICQRVTLGLFYECSSCPCVYIHLKCASLGTFIEIGEKTHQHKFNLVWRQDSFICDACGTEGNYASYTCSTCHVQVHEKCTSLPHLIRITRHYDHPVSHKYFVEGYGLDQKLECRICYGEVKKVHGCYTCLKKDCDYIVHVNCAIVKGNYWIINEDEPEDLPEEPSITEIIKNDKGEVVKIKHFAHHQHYLMVGDEIKEGEDKCCDGCLLSISGLFYYCAQAQCDFFLHKTCAELLRKKHHWFHQHLTTLHSPSTFPFHKDKVNQIKDFIHRCQFCDQWGSGLFYICHKRFCLKVCLRCASLPDAHVNPGLHKHRIIFDSNYRGECNACGDIIRRPTGGFRCGGCKDYALDFKCMTLPVEVQHKCDKHLLKLAYGDENDDPKKHYCDICEEKRDPNRWFYLCSVCDNSVHPQCVLGEHPFIKIGGICICKNYHPHPLTFVKKVYDYPGCGKCGKPCVALALECPQSECHFIIHAKCALSYHSFR